MNIEARLSDRRRLRELRSKLSSAAAEAARARTLHNCRILFETGEAGRGIA